MVAPEQLQKKFGGTAENKKDNFWPPISPCEEYRPFEEGDPSPVKYEVEGNDFGADYGADAEPLKAEEILGE